MNTELVACNGCTACCQNELLILHPEYGDDPDGFETIAVINPLTGKPEIAIKPGDAGHCRYLGDGGCTIYDRRPAMCRQFSCVGLFKRLSRAERRRAIKAGLASAAVIEAGRKRLHDQQV